MKNVSDVTRVVKRIFHSMKDCMKQGWGKVAERSWVGLSKATRLPTLHSLRQAAALQGLADLLETKGAPSLPRAGRPMSLSHSWGEYLPLQLAASLAQEPGWGEAHYAAWSHALCILMNESGDRLNLKEELQLSGWVKGSQGMLWQLGEHRKGKKGAVSI